MQPAQWNSGMMEVQRSPASSPSRLALLGPTIIMARCDSSAPLGNPVVPEV